MTTTISEPVRAFFEAFERDSNARDQEPSGAQFGEVFLFCTPQGARPIRRDDLVRALPKRREFFETLGLKSTTFASLDEQPLDDHYILVEAHLIMHFEKETTGPVDDNVSSTFILRRGEYGLEIACHIEHEEVTDRMKSLGLMPAE